MSRRSFWAWGLEQDEPTEQQVREAAARLSQRYGVAVEPVEPPRSAGLRLRKPRISPPSSLAAICASDDHDRAVHTYGRSFRDRIRAFNLQFPNPPDIVAHPTTEDEVTAALDWCSSSGYAAIPYGGGSSTVAGFEPPDGYDGIVTIDFKRYGANAIDPYRLGLRVMVELLCDAAGPAAGSGTIIVEKRGEFLDRDVEDTWTMLRTRGSLYAKADVIRETIKALELRDKKENITGLQLADLVITPIGRHILGKPDKDDWRIVEQKLRRGPDGHTNNYGLIVFPIQ